MAFTAITDNEFVSHMQFYASELTTPQAMQEFLAWWNMRVELLTPTGLDISAIPRDNSLASWVVDYAPIDDPMFLENILFYKDTFHTARDFMEFLLKWESRDEFHQNFLKNSYFGIIQQHLGVLDNEANGYINSRSGYWYNRIPLRVFLEDLVSAFPA